MMKRIGLQAATVTVSLMSVVQRHKLRRMKIMAMKSANHRKPHWSQFRYTRNVATKDMMVKLINHAR